MVCTPVEDRTALTSISAGAFVEFCENKLTILLDFEDSIFDLGRIGTRDRFSVNVEDEVHLVRTLIGRT